MEVTVPATQNPINSTRPLGRMVLLLGVIGPGTASLARTIGPGAALLFLWAVSAWAQPAAVDPVEPLEFAGFASRWSELHVDADSLHLVEIARNESGRDSLRVALAVGLARWVRGGAQRFDEVPPAAAEWIRERVREGFLLSDPRWRQFSLAVAEQVGAADLLARIDPEGDWSLPGALYLLSTGQTQAADRWISVCHWPADDRAYLAVLAVEARQSRGIRSAAALADSLLRGPNLPSWTREPLEEVRIESLIEQDRHGEAGVLLEEYGRTFAQGPWYFGTRETVARGRGDIVAADSLAWIIAERYPGSARAKRWLETQVPLGAPRPSLSRKRLEVLLDVAEQSRGLTRFLLLADEIVSLVDPSARAAEKRRLDLRAAELAYSTRRYEDLFSALGSGRIEPSRALIGRWGLILGRAYRNTGQPDSMAAWFDRTAKNGSVGDRNSALWEWGRELESLRRFSEAESVYERLLTLGAGDREEDTNLRVGFVRFQQKRYADAESAYARVVRSATAWRVATAEYWSFRCRLASGDEAGARSALERAARAPDGYYSARARSALAMEPGVPITELGDYWKTLSDLAELPGLEQIPFRADMASERVGNPAGLPSRLRLEAERLWLFRQYGRGSWAQRALDALDADPALGNGADRIARLHALGFPDLATRRVIRTHRSETELRYPAPYGAAVAAAAKRGGLAPEWMWAVMRRESFFEATVQSPAGALGLMQFMPGTADRVGARHGIPSEPLTSPVVNLALGITHLRELVDETGGDWPQILAGYNAGMHNAVRWLHPDDDPDVFIEMIGYRETRDYVKAVLEGFWIYRETLRVTGIDTGLSETPVPSVGPGGTPTGGAAGSPEGVPEGAGP